MKLCPRCKSEHPLTEFRKRKDGRLYSYCRSCNAEMCRESREKARMPSWRPCPLNVAFVNWLQVRA
jgi:hypothetical protein